MLKTLILLILLMMAISMCNGCGSVHPIPDNPSCTTFCANALRLDCDFSRPTDEGQECADWCGDLMAVGYIELDLGCRSVAESCDAIDRCER